MKPVTSDKKPRRKMSNAMRAMIRRNLEARRMSGKPTSVNERKPNPPNKVRQEIKHLMQPNGVIAALDIIRSDLEGAQHGYQSVLHDNLARIYQIARYVRESDDGWADLCSDEAWTKLQDRNRPRIADKSDALRHTIRFALGFDGTAVTKRVSEINTALDPFFRRNAHVQEVEKSLREIGLSELIKEGRRHRRCDSLSTSMPPSFTVTFKKSELEDQLRERNDGEKISLCANIYTDPSTGCIELRVMRLA